MFAIFSGGHPIFHRPNPFRPPLPEEALLWPLASLGLPTFNAEHAWSCMPFKNWLHLKLNCIQQFTYRKMSSWRKAGLVWHWTFHPLAECWSANVSKSSKPEPLICSFCFGQTVKSGQIQRLFGFRRHIAQPGVIFSPVLEVSLPSPTSSGIACDWETGDPPL